MDPFKALTGIAAPIPVANVNTDIISPKALMRAVSKEGLGWGFFGPFRYNDDGSENPDFVLNREPFRQAKIIVARENFGCGSSREHAAWAMQDFGVRAVIAPSYAEIFFNNCVKNGILPIILPAAKVEQLLEAAATAQPMTIDLPSQTISAPNLVIPFEIPEALKSALLEGRDEIDSTMHHDDAIQDFESRMFEATPWLKDGVGS